MKHNQLDNFIQKLESIKMTSFEKNTLREKLVAFSSTSAPVSSPYYNMMSIAKRSFALAFVVIFSIASFSNAASKNSLPGDIFYPVKIAHEEIALATTFGTSKKITYEIRRTEKRIQEATLLAQNSDIETPAEQISVVENIKKQTTKVKQHIENVKKSNPEEALLLNSELKSTVKINQAALRNVQSATTLTEEIPETVDIKSETLSTISLPADDHELNNNSSSRTREAVTLSFVEVTEDTPQSSFVNSLLESLDEEVRSIEAFEDNVEEEILKDENSSVDAISKDTNTSPLETSETEPRDTHASETIEEDVQSAEIINSEIKSLENIIEIKKSIKAIKPNSEMHVHTIINEEGNQVLFDETLLRKEVDELIAHKKYKQAFLKLQEILEHFQNEKITKNVAESIPVPEPSTDKVIKPSSDISSALQINQ